MKRLLTLIVATVLLFAAAPRAQAIGPIPEIVTSTNSTVLFYILGLIDGQAQVAAIAAAPATVQTFRDRAATQRALAYMLSDSPIGMAYLFGKAQAFDDAADAAGEPAR